MDTSGQQYSYVSMSPEITQGTAIPTLPGSDAGISAAQTISLNGDDYRAVGASVPGQPLVEFGKGLRP